MTKCEQRIAELKDIIPEISVTEAHEMQQANAIIIDVRTLEEHNEKHIKNCIHLGRDFLEFKIEKHISNPDQVIITACGGGLRSLFAAESLTKLGYNKVYNMAGGFRAWEVAKLPTE